MTDFLLNADGDLEITDGDLTVGESLIQHQRELLLLDKGHLVFSPTAGVGAERFLLDDNTNQLRAACKVELQRDGLPSDIDPFSLIVYRD